MISVIIPVYNASHYLERCLSSLLNQTYTDFEILLINDGSTDLSLDICQDYAKKNKCVKVFSQTNLGVSSARNKGIEYASGQYICFVDADDWVECNYLEALLKKIEECEADLAISNVRNIYPSRSFSNSKLPDCMVQCENMLPSHLFDNEEFILQNSVWNKMFVAALIKENEIFFRADLKNGEDFIFVLEYGLKCKKICFTNVYTYNYDRTAETSGTSKYFKDYYYHLSNTKRHGFEILERYSTISFEDKLYQYFRVASKAIAEEFKMDNPKTFFAKYLAVKAILNIDEVKQFRERHQLRRESSPFFSLIQKLMMVNTPLLISIFLNIYYTKENLATSLKSKASKGNKNL